MNIVILDLEWNGSYSKKVHHYVNEIIEFGAVKVDEDFNILGEFSILVKPEIGKKLSSHIAALTHITNDELFSKGISFIEASEKFGEFSKGCPILTWGTSDILTLMDNFSYYTVFFEKFYLAVACVIAEIVHKCEDIRCTPYENRAAL